MDNNKKVIFSAVQPSGALTLGNYLGAIKNWVDMQEDFNCIFALADLHAVTVRQDPAELRKRIIELYAIFLACGIDPEKSLFFIQSQVPTHAELGWILNCFTQFGELSRMTQFKDKSKKHAENINVGLFCYPSLMAADILLYDAELVPVGADQKQHVEITRNIAQRFNGIYGDTFTLPEPFIPKVGARVMSLQDPSKKMSKSDTNPNGCILMMDSPDDIIKKFKKAVTDSNSQVKYRGEGTGIDNLISIYSALTKKTMNEIETEFEGKGYGDFKIAVANIVVDTLVPIQEKVDYFIKNKDYLKCCYKKSAEKALEISEKTLKAVKEKIGFICY